MALSKEKKESVVKSIAEKIAKAKTLVFVKFKGISVNDLNLVRKSLRESEVFFTVVKKTLLKRALSDRQIEGSLPDLSGEIALVGGEDQLSPARSIFAFQKQYKEKLEIVGGVFEGLYKDKTLMTEIAGIPGKEVLLAQLAQLLSFPIRGLAVTLSEVGKKNSGNV